MESFECCICFKQFEDPRVLPCGHTFCKGCLESLKKRNCPLCRAVFESKVHNLPSNFVVCAWMEENKTKSSSPPNPTTIPCHNCENVASLWCENCSNGIYLCSDCSKTIHSMKAFSSHKPLTMREKSKRMTFDRCQLHFKEKEFYCVNDHVSLCYACTIDDHKSHEITSIFKYAEKVRGELKQYLLPFKNTSSLKQEEQQECEDKRKNEEALKKLKEQLKELEDKIKNNEKNLLRLKEAQEKVITGELVLQKTIEELSVSDLINKEKVEAFRSKVQSTVQQIAPTVFRDRELKGHDYRSYAIGGVVFAMTALKPIQVTSVGIMTREPGKYNVAVKRTNGICKTGMNSWTDVVTRTAFDFQGKTITQVWKGVLNMRENESVSWAISNQGNENSGEIVASDISKQCVSDGNLNVYLVSFLDKRKEWQFSSEDYYKSFGFIGSVGYMI